MLSGAYVLGRAGGNRGFSMALHNRERSNRLLLEMRANLHRSAEAEKIAVMADTDESSEAYANKSKLAAVAVEEARRKLGREIESAKHPERTKLFEEFSAAWSRHQKLDREILDLAVENSNLKATRLSFGPSSESLARFEVAVREAMRKSESPPGSAVAVAAFEALVAATKIHALHARHIAEARDEEMDRIELEMTALDGQVMRSLDALAASINEAAMPNVEAARRAYMEFKTVHDQILALSRRNSNVRSLAMSLNEKGKATAICEERLRALQEAIQSD
jgi:hypothetical protein